MKLTHALIVIIAALLLGCKASEQETNAPHLTSAPNVTPNILTATTIARATERQSVIATQTAIMEARAAAKATPSNTPPANGLQDPVQPPTPTAIPSAADILVTGNYLPEGAVGQIPGIYHPTDLAGSGEKYKLISDGQSLRVYDTATSALLWSVRFADDAHGVAKSPDERWIVATIRERHYLWETATGKLTNTIQGAAYDGGLTSWSTDSKLLMVRNDGVTYEGIELALINPETNADIFVINDESADIGHSLWTHDGRYLITGNRPYGFSDHEIVVRDAATGVRLRAMTGEQDGRSLGSVATLYLDPDEIMLLAIYGQAGGDTMSVPGVMILWDIETGNEVHRFEYPGIWDARFSPGGSKIALTSKQGSGDEAIAVLPIWDAASGELLAEIEFPEPDFEWWYITDGEWSPNGALIAAVVDRRIMIFDALRSEYVRTLDGIADSVEWSSDGEKVRSSTHEWNLVTGEITRRDDALITGIGDLRDVEWLPDGSGVVIAGRDAVQVWAVDLNTNVKSWYLRSIRLDELDVPVEPWLGIFAIAISPDGTTLATAQPGVIALWDMQSGSLRRTLIQPDEGLDGWDYPNITDVAWSPDGRWVAAISDTVHVWDAASGDLRYEFHENGIGLAFSPDSQGIATVGSGAVVWSLETGEQMLKVNLPEGDSVAWSPDGSLLVVGTGGYVFDPGSIVIIPMQPPDETITMQEQPQPVTSLAWLPGQRYIVAAGGHSKREYGAHLFSPGNYGGSLFLWDAQSGQFVRSLDGHTAEVQAVALSPNGALIASASADGTVLIWSVPTP